MADDPNLEERKRLYERTRDELTTISKSASESYDRALLTLSSAFLGGSFAFIDGVVELKTAGNKWMLYGAWLCFALTIVTTLGSFVFSLLGFQKLRDSARKYYLEGVEEAQQVSARFQNWVLRFAIVAGVLFAGGIALLAIFVTLNVMKEPGMTQDRQERSIPPAIFEKPIQLPQPSEPTQPPAAAPQVPAQQAPQK